MHFATCVVLNVSQSVESDAPVCATACLAADKLRAVRDGMTQTSPGLQRFAAEKAGPHAAGAARLKAPRPAAEKASRRGGGKALPPFSCGHEGCAVFGKPFASSSAYLGHLRTHAVAAVVAEEPIARKASKAPSPSLSPPSDV